MAIKKDTMDHILSGRDPREVFSKDRLFDELNKAVAERVLNAVHASRECQERFVAKLFYAFFCIAALLLVADAIHRGFDPDEFQHIQMAWLVAQGELPYRDFFEHHTPLYHFLISPLLRYPSLTTNGDTAVQALFGLRILGVVLSLGIVWATYFLAQKLFTKLSGLFAAALLLGCSVLVHIGIEIRPDQLATLFLFSATIALYQTRDANNYKGWLAVSGAAFALGVLTTQKCMFAAPGFAVALIVLSVQRGNFLRQSTLNFGSFALGSVVATLPVILYFAAQGALLHFITDNFLLGAHWERKLNVAALSLMQIGREDVLLLLCALIGFIMCLSPSQTHWKIAVLSPGLSMLLLVPFFPVAYYEYFFLLMPYIAVFAGAGADCLVKDVVSRKVPIAACLGLIVAIHGALILIHGFVPGNYPELDKLRYVIEKTSPGSAVLSSWTPGIAFRKLGFFYYSLHSEIVHIIPNEDREKLKQIILDHKTSPELVEIDEAFKTGFPELLPILESRYSPTGVGTLWRKKKDSE
jgi:hypothetical protein